MTLYFFFSLLTKAYHEDGRFGVFGEAGDSFSGRSLLLPGCLNRVLSQQSIYIGVGKGVR